MKLDTFRVIFRGEVLEGNDPIKVKSNMAKLFKLDMDDPDHLAKLEKLFSGRTLVIKDKISKADALKYKQAISEAGAQCSIEPNMLEQRKDQRRKRGDRRTVRRTSAIQPDRRTKPGRRKSDKKIE